MRTFTCYMNVRKFNTFSLGSFDTPQRYHQARFYCFGRLSDDVCSYHCNSGAYATRIATRNKGIESDASARPLNLSSASRDLDLWPPIPKVDRFTCLPRGPLFPFASKSVHSFFPKHPVPRVALYSIVERRATCTKTAVVMELPERREIALKITPLNSTGGSTVQWGAGRRCLMCWTVTAGSMEPSFILRPLPPHSSSDNRVEQAVSLWSSWKLLLCHDPCP